MIYYSRRRKLIFVLKFIWSQGLQLNAKILHCSKLGEDIDEFGYEPKQKYMCWSTRCNDIYLCFFPRPSGHVLITHSVLWYTKFIKTYILFFYLLCISPCLCLPPPSHHPLFLCMCVCLSVEVRSHFVGDSSNILPCGLWESNSQSWQQAPYPLSHFSDPKYVLLFLS